MRNSVVLIAIMIISPALYYLILYKVYRLFSYEHSIAIASGCGHFIVASSFHRYLFNLDLSKNYFLANEIESLKKRNNQVENGCIKAATDGKEL